MTGTLMVQWFQWFNRQIVSRKVILVIDSFSVHQSVVNELRPLLEEYSFCNMDIYYLLSSSISKT
jgi:hypothetical protein